MRRLRSDYTAEDCAKRLKEALWEQRGWLRREPVRGFTAGRLFRIHNREMPRYHQDHERVGCVLYGHIIQRRRDTEVRIWEFSRGQDPLLWAQTIAVSTWMFSTLTDGSLISILVFLLMHVIAIGFLLMNYQLRAEKYEALTVDLRYFVRKALDAEEIRGEEP